MRSRPLFWAAVLASLAALLAPGAARSVVHIGEAPGVQADEYDSRTARVAPTKAQRASVARLGARVTWNRFGTPASLTRHGRFLATGIQGKSAAAAARSWLQANRSAFGLASAANLVLEADSPLRGSAGHAVSFRQVFGGLEAAEGGLVTVGLTGSAARGWKVAYASSSLTRSTQLAAGRVALSAEQGWVRAARAVGERVTVDDVRSAKRLGGWETFTVEDADSLQRAKLVAFPTPRRGVAPAYESLVVDKANSLAERVFVDARDGSVLARFNLVENVAESQLVPQTIPFSGELPAVNGGCAPKHGPFAVGSGVRFLRIFADADGVGQDIVLRLFFGTTLVAVGDVFIEPEVIHYEPAGGVPPGDYFVEVCEFPGQPGPVEPRTYTGTFTIDDTPAPHPYLARWQVFPANPPLATLPADPWGNPSTDTRELWCWTEGDSDDCDRVVGNSASRGPWDFNFKANTPTNTTIGNNANSATSWTHPLMPSPPQFRPVSASRDYLFPWTNEWFREDCEPTPGTPGATWDDSAATVNLFAMHNRMHDFSYFLGFTERNWNAQDFNFGLTETFRENDPIIGNVQSGVLAGARDNANMITLPEGVPSITNMYMWQPLVGFYAPCVDGDYDMGVIGHEYGHMIENRMIGKGTNRSGHHAGAMGESFGDFVAMEYLNSNGFVPTGDENPFAVGTYATGNKVRAIRNYGMNFPTSGGVPEPSQQLSINALNFSDMGYDVTGPQVHADGEIWSKTNFANRQLLINKYNTSFPASDGDLQYQCANGELPAQSCPGNRRWIQIVFDSMLLMPTNPSMLQARDAQLAADLMRFGGANQRELWLGFARQGFGRNATSTNTTANTDTDPTPDFEPIGTEPANVTFRARMVGGGNVSVPARFFVGHYEGRVSPIADTDPASNGVNLDEIANFAPGTYEFVARAEGFGHVRFRARFRSGQTRTITVRFVDNWASANQGAFASGDTSGADPAAQAAQLRNLIDDTEATNWTTAGNIDASGNLSVDGKRVTVDLAGVAAHVVDVVQVSAMLGAGQNRFTALRQFEIWACNAAEGANCASDAGYTLQHASAADAFPGDPPRPVAPHLILRRFDVSDFFATHLRFVVRTNQCTGGPAFQGDQDADPANNPDCDSNVAPNSPLNAVRAAELQAFSGDPSVTGN